jgi:regulator of RNase E activity RraA
MRSVFARVPRLAANALICAGGNCRASIPAASSAAQSRHSWPGKDRVACAEVGGTVTIGGINVRQDDIVVADGNGVVVVPRERAAEVARIAREIDAIEAQIIRDIQSGSTLREARARHGYHKLQTKGA